MDARNTVRMEEPPSEKIGVLRCGSLRVHSPSLPRQRYTRILHPLYITFFSPHHRILTIHKMSYTIAGRAIKVSHEWDNSAERS